MPPLSLWILLHPQDEASCHLKGRGEARRSSEPGCAACGPVLLARRGGWSVSTREAWWRAGEHGTRSSGGAEEGSYLIHLTDVANSFGTAAAGDCRSRSDDDRHHVHGDSAVQVPLLMRPDEGKRRSSALRHAAQAHTQRVGVAGAVEWGVKQARPQKGIPHSYAAARRAVFDSRGKAGGAG